MKATELLEAQHKEVKSLFKQIEESRIRDDKSALFEMLAHSLVAHDVIEREIFYPACEEKMGMNRLLGEALTEHGLVEFSLYVADEARGGHDFEHKCQVLREVVEHHVKEEETELLPKVETALGEELLEALGAKMKARFEEARKADFREPLRDSLREVMAGAATDHTGPDGKKPAKKTAKNGASHDKARNKHA